MERRAQRWGGAETRVPTGTYRRCSTGPGVPRLGSSVAALSVKLNADDAPVIDFIVAAAATTTFGTSLTEATQMQRDEVDFDSGRRDYCSYIHRTLPSRMQGAHTPFLV